LTHGGIANDVRVQVRMVESGDVERNGAEAMLSGVCGVLVPGGFGQRGIEGKISAVRYARERGIPFFGICLGMQCAVMEFARNVCDMEGANSTEFAEDTPFPVIDLMEEQKKVTDMGGTMRLGAYPCALAEGSLAREAYGASLIIERHRHRYEYNNEYRETLEKHGLSCTGLHAESGLVEIVEHGDSPWFVACQFHPEFQSTPLHAHPLFREFVHAAMGQRDAGTA
jgi:CTP synthase